MRDLIDRQAVLDAIDDIDKTACMNEYHAIVKAIDDLPSVTPTERTGHWKQISPARIYECSECGGVVMTDEIDVYNFCHHCGARMDGDAE